MSLAIRAQNVKNLSFFSLQSSAGFGIRLTLLPHVVVTITDRHKQPKLYT
jgi:hypothetical protein